MPAVSIEIRQDIANRRQGGQPVAAISADLGVPIRTIHRLLREFEEDDGQLVARPSRRRIGTSISRDHLIALSGYMSDNPKITLQQILYRSIEDGHFSQDASPDIATIYRALKQLGWTWRKPEYVDPHAKRDVNGYETCLWKSEQANGNLNPTMMLSFDESNFTNDVQATRAWSKSKYIGVELEKSKGQVMRRILLATIGFKMVSVGDEYKPRILLHWVLVPPRRSHLPPSDTIQTDEEETKEQTKMIKKLSQSQIDYWQLPELRKALCDLDVRCEEATRPVAMRAVLMRIMQTGTRAGLLRKRERGRPSVGGPIEPMCISARSISEYFYRCLAPFVKGDGLNAADSEECRYTADVGLSGCPDYGRMEITPWPDAGMNRILLDNAKPHLPPSATPSDEGEIASAFDTWMEDTLGFGPPLFLPPYGFKLQPIELLFAFLKKKIRVHNPTTTPELIRRLRQASEEVTAVMVMNWYRKCGYIVPNFDETPGEEDPNKGIRDRCSIGRDAKFQARESIACFSADGVLRKTKPTGRHTWAKYDESKDREGLLNLSVQKRSGVKRTKRYKGLDPSDCALPEDGKIRHTGLFEVQEGEKLKHAENETLWSPSDDFSEIEDILEEKTTSDGKMYKIRWKNRSDDFDEWVSSDHFGTSTLAREWKSRKKQRTEDKQLNRNKRDAERPEPEYVADRDNVEIGDVLAILASDSSTLPLHVCRVLSVTGDTLTCQWYGAKSIDGMWTEQWEKGLVNGKAAPYSAKLKRNNILDKIKSMKDKKKGKIQTEELKKLMVLIEKTKRK